MSNNKSWGGVIVIVSLAMMCLGSAAGLFAQDTDAALLKKLILLKYDLNHDGALIGIEKDGAVTFLKKTDKDRNDEISEEEATVAIVALRKMPSPTKQTEAKKGMPPKVKAVKRPASRQLPITATQSLSNKGPSGRSVFSRWSSNLVSVTHNGVSSYKMKEEPTYYLLYFSAQWCPPCQVTTPVIVKFYNEFCRKAQPKVEVIFVSQDRDKESMEKYMTTYKMPWPAIPFEDVKKARKINKYAGPGIPCLVLVNRRGKVLSDSYADGPSVVLSDVFDYIKLEH